MPDTTEFTVEIRRTVVLADQITADSPDAAVAAAMSRAAAGQLPVQRDLVSEIRCQLPGGAPARRVRPKPTIPAHVAQLIGELLGLRTQQKLTQRDLAARMRISQPMISRMESLDLLPSVRQLRAWCAALGRDYPFD